MFKEIEQVLVDQLRATNPQLLNTMFTNNRDRDSREIWFKFGRRSSLKEREWLKRQMKSNAVSLSAVMCAFAAIQGINKVTFGEAERNLGIIVSEVCNPVAQS